MTAATTRSIACAVARARAIRLAVPMSPAKTFSCHGACVLRSSPTIAVVEEVVAAAAGGGGSVLIEGEAGIGKTRLLQRFRTRAASGSARVLSTTADEGEAAVPLAVARALLGKGGRRPRGRRP